MMGIANTVRVMPRRFKVDPKITQKPQKPNFTKLPRWSPAYKDLQEARRKWRQENTDRPPKGAEPTTAYDFARSKADYYRDQAGTVIGKAEKAYTKGNIKEARKLENWASRLKEVQFDYDATADDLRKLHGGDKVPAYKVFGTRRLSKGEREYSDPAARASQAPAERTSRGRGRRRR